MSRLAAWCPQGAKMMTFDDLKLRVDDEHRKLGYRCPRCGRVLRCSQWSDASRWATGDSRGWLGTSGMRWPRHYSWAAPRRRTSAPQPSRTIGSAQ